VAARQGFRRGRAAASIRPLTLNAFKFAHSHTADQPERRKKKAARNEFSRSFGLGGSLDKSEPHFRHTVKSVTATTRKPLLSFLLFGLFLLRYAQRAFLASLLKDPPRNTRLVRTHPRILTVAGL